MIESRGSVGCGRTKADVNSRVGMTDSEKVSFLHALNMKITKSNSTFDPDLKLIPNLSDILHAKLSDTRNFTEVSVSLFNWQYQNNEVYRKYVDLIGINSEKVKELSQIPFLPVEFFKNHKVLCQDIDYQTVFTSSSTSKTGVSSHYIRNTQDYFDTTKFCFSEFLGDFNNFCHLALLPSYLEREGSSLISMIAHFNQKTNYKMGGFYLNEFEDLKSLLLQNEKMKIPTILWGVSFALLDFAEFFNNKLQHTIVIETGGMKGRRKEITRSEMYHVLEKGFGKSSIASEYGMTEMMSQCYSHSNGIYSPPPHVRVFGREINDPFSFVKTGRNKALNIIDLANIHSCAFLSLSDIGNIYEDGTFEVLGRLDLSDVRGCNLMIK